MSIDKTNILNNRGSQISNITNGVLVVLNTHPYSDYNEDYKMPMFIKDFPLVDSPIMVVGECIKNFKDIYDEKSGELKIGKDSFQCKCFWYNHKSGTFEETWLSDKALSIIPLNLEDEVECGNIKINDVVSLRSLPLEKAKVSRLFETRTSERTTELYKSNAIHNYEPPIMQIIETKIVEGDEKYDVKSGKKKKFSTNKLVKCKWFNTFLNKFSETWLPIDVLLKRPEVDKELLNVVNEAIINKMILKTRDFLIEPLGINSDGFYWSIEGYNLVANKFQCVSFRKFGGMVPIEKRNCFTSFFNCRNIKLNDKEKTEVKEGFNPDLLKNKKLKIIKEEIDRHKKANLAIRILYKNLEGELSKRVLTDYIFDGSSLLIGFCQFKGEVRKFNLLSIRTIEAVEFPYIFINRST